MTYAHKDIAFEFASWISAEFKLYIITDYQRLKNDENSKLSLQWNISKELSKINYKIHTDAIKEVLVPNLPKEYKVFVYANEADVLNMAMFGMTAKQWREGNIDKAGNIRDYATLYQLIVLSNLESFNSDFIHKGMDRDDRIVALNKIAKRQMKSLQDSALMESNLLIEK